jgi:RNA polymerase sigma-70 factor (ECF subfamily)
MSVMTNSSSEELYRRFVSAGDVSALAQVFDRLAPDLVRLARQLIGDRHQAEDLVQETFLVAIEQRETFDESRSIQPWLVGILVNRARSVRRANERMLDVERLVERSVPTPHVEAALSEHRETLDVAVAELPEKLRAVVEAKLAGRDSGKLASDLGISQGALRARMFRGLQRLRESLPAGLASAFAIAFLHSTGLARARTSVLGEASKHPAAKGVAGLATGIWMTKSGVAALVLGVVALGVVLAVVVRSFEEKGDVGVEIANETTRPSLPVANDFDEQVEEVSRREVVEVRPPMIKEEVVRAERTGASLAGVVFDQNGLAVPFADVMGWNAMPNRSVTIEGEPHLQTRANEYGAFVIEGLGDSFAITAKTETLACSEGLKGTLSQGSSVSGLKLMLAPAGTLRGVVRSRTEIPVPGAEVWLSNGLSGSSSRDLTGVDGVTKFRAGKGRTKTSETGEFELSGLPPNSNYLNVKMKPYLVYTKAHSYTDGLVEVTLDAGLSLRGSVVDSDGNPAGGARVRRWPFAGNTHTVDQDVIADANGEFLLTSFFRYPADLLSKTISAIGVSHNGHAVEFIEHVTPGERGGEWVTVQLSPEKVIAGQVVDLNGAPVAGVRVWIEGDREMEVSYEIDRRSTWEYVFGIADLYTGADGRFRFERLYPGKFTVNLVLSEEERLSLDRIVESGAEDLELVFDRNAVREAVIEGRVTDVLTGEPIQSFVTISWRQRVVRGGLDSAVGTNKAFDQSDGKYELTGFNKGEFAITFKAEGYCDLKTKEREYSSGVNTLDIELSPARSLTLSVVENGVEIHKDGGVRAVRSNDERLSLKVGASSTANLVSLHDGKAFLHGLPAEPITFQVDVPGYDTAWLTLDLTEPYEGVWPIELIPTKLIQLNLLVVNGGTDVDLDEFLTRRKHIRDGDNAKWVWSTMFDTPGLLPTAAVELAARLPNGRVHSTSSMTPSKESIPDARSKNGLVEMSMFAIENKSFGVNGFTGSSSSSSQPWPVLSFMVPLEDMTINVVANGHHPIEFKLDLSGVTDDETWEAIVLTPFDR